MKKMLFLFVLLNTVLNLAVAGEFTGGGKINDLLEDRGYSVDRLRETGHSLMMGEFTGGGKRVQLNRVRLMVTEDDVLPVNSVDEITFKSRAARPLRSEREIRSSAALFNDVQAIEANGRSVPQSSIRALIVQ